MKIDTQLAHFPAPVGSDSRVAELREKVIKQFRTTMEELFNQFCPEQCLLADFEVKTEVVNPEEAQYGSPGEFIQDGGVAVRIKDISSTVLMDDLLTPEEQKNVIEMARLKTNVFKNVTLASRSMHFPHPDYMVGNGKGAAGRALGNANGTGSTDEKNQNRSLASDSKESSTSASSSTQNNQSSSSNQSSNSSQNNETNQKQEKFERFEKIERVESDAVRAELKKFGLYGLIFGCAVISLLIFVAMATLRPQKAGESAISRIVQSISGDPAGAPPTSPSTSITSEDHRQWWPAAMRSSGCWRK